MTEKKKKFDKDSSENINLFSDFMVRQAKPKVFKATFSGLPHGIKANFPEFLDFKKNALLAEISLFPDSGSRNFRVSLAEREELSFLATKIGNLNQVPYLLVLIHGAFLVFSNSTLRSHFNNSLVVGTPIPMITQKIETYVRETFNTHVSISFSSNCIPCEYKNFEGTIFDQHKLLEDPEKREALFSFLRGDSISGSYLKLIKFVPYCVHSFRTNMCSVTSLDFTFRDNKWYMDFYPFTTIKKVNYLIEPTKIEGYIPFFSGFKLISKTENLSTGTTTTDFRLEVSKHNIFYKMFTFFLSDVIGYLTTSNLDIEDEQVAMFSTSSSKIANDVIHQIAFANNLARFGSQNMFMNYARRNGLLP
jgi:hypothetical protein